MLQSPYPKPMSNCSAESCLIRNGGFSDLVLSRHFMMVKQPEAVSVSTNKELGVCLFTELSVGV